MGLFAVDKKEMVRFHASSGTTGKPTVVGYTRKDLDVWLNNVARIACMGGATPDDVAQIAFGYGTFTGALGLHGGLEKLGQQSSLCHQEIPKSRLCLCKIWRRPFWWQRRLMRYI